MDPRLNFFKSGPEAMKAMKASISRSPDQAWRSHWSNSYACAHRK
jgi:hypothetical protein